MTVTAGSSEFEAVLYPNQPPNSRAFTAVLIAVAAVLAVIGVGFAAAGAWPIIGFLGLDIVLLMMAFSWARREATRREHIRLDKSGLIIRCVEPGGAERQWRFEPHWVQVCIDEPTRRESHLTLRQQDRTLTLGRFLTPDERLDFARTLRSALKNHVR